MKEIGMLFSTDMVHAIVDGRKTQTRRLIITKIFYIALIKCLMTWNHSIGAGIHLYICQKSMPVSGLKSRVSVFNG